MAKVKARPITSKDIDRFVMLDEKPPLHGFCIEIDGEVEGMIGIMLIDGNWTIFANLTEAARRFKMHIMRSAVRVMDIARNLGISQIRADKAESEPMADKWLKNLGFIPEQKSCITYVWKASEGR